ncbi:DUF6283 family protein [Streptomyces sp. cg35]|uniref:DUF6283 family protein n=1 Tax=Streptomyces sp. cg35 TaxID=3421650 RepID=UPI003D180EC3
MSTLPPAKTPCAACPYRRDVPAGVWSAEDYAKLPPYDGETGAQPAGVFQCHLYDGDDERARVCGGWAGCHDGVHLLALRLALVTGGMSAADVEATVDYESPVPLFASGAEAAAHGMSGIETPGEEALAAMSKIRRTRSDLDQR